MPTDLELAARTVASVNPATGEILRELESASDATVQTAVARARAAQPAWQALDANLRIALLRKFQRQLQEDKSAGATLITKEAGKPYVGALLTEVLVVLDASRFLIDNAYGFLREEAVPHGSLAMKTKVGRILREPHGVI